MGRSKNLSPDVQKALKRGYEQGMTQVELANQFDIPRTTVSGVLNRIRRNGDVLTKKSPGRPRITSRLVDRNILRLSRSNPRLTAVDITRTLAGEGGPNASIRTVRRRLQAAGLHGRRPVKKPLLSLKNRKARVKFAKEHIGWTREQWNNVIWSDESKFLLFGSDGIQYVRRPLGRRFDPKYQLPTVKHGGGSLMVWGCFCGNGVGPLFRIQGIMDKNKYLDILEKVMLPYGRSTLGRRLIFQQDNDPKHTSGVVRQWFIRRRLNVLEWPSQSPDLNPIEHLWEELDRRLRHRQASNIEEKFQQLLEEWKKIPQSVIDNLLESMPRRCQAVIDSKGFPTKY